VSDQLCRARFLSFGVLDGQTGTPAGIPEQANREKVAIVFD